MILCVKFLCELWKDLTQKALYTSFVLGLGKVILYEFGLVGKA